MNARRSGLLRRSVLVGVSVLAFPSLFIALLAKDAKVIGAAEPPEVCFFDNNLNTSVKREGCRPDPLKLLQLNDLKVAMDVLHVPKDRLEFEGCTQTRFTTSPPAAAIPGHGKYKIYYPVVGRSDEDYVGPIIHELAHVYQLESIGSSSKLLDKYSMLQIELGADYMTGIVAGHYLQGARPKVFQDNLELVGLYREDDSGAHGTPNQRNAAFRLGYFLPSSKFGSQIAQAYQEYDDDGFPFLAQQQK